MWKQSPNAKLLGSSGAFITVVLTAVAVTTVALAEPANVIIFIGDGMGFEQVKAGGDYAHGYAGAFGFESFPHQARITTRSASSSVTDSAAAATALATGTKVNNGVISMAYPGDGHELLTLLEHCKSLGKSTGLVTTTYVTHATPAGFGAHESSRDRTSEIAGDYLTQTRPGVLFGGGGNGMSVSGATSAGYAVLQDRSALLSLDTEASSMVSGQFGTTYLPYEFDGLGSLPHLSEMAAVAINVLDNDPDGFFLMVEGGKIDQACHSNDLARAVHEVVEFDRAVQVAVDWARGRSDTLILVTADHETGGLTVLSGNGAGSYPTVSWSTTGHTGVDVPLYAWGANAELFGGTMDNTEVFGAVTSSPVTAATSPNPADGAAGVEVNVLLSWTPGEGAISHDVYFGAANPPPFAARQTGSTFDPGLLMSGTTYFWRVDEIGSSGTMPGSVWSFVTADAACTPTACHVSSVVLETISGSRGKKFGRATVTVLDDCGQPVPSAAVTGQFTGSFSKEAPQTQLTDASGVAVFTTTTQLKKPAFSFSVTSVARDGLEWTSWAQQLSSPQEKLLQGFSRRLAGSRAR